MEIMDGVGTDRWEVGMATEEKWRRKPEERKYQIPIKGPRNRNSFR